MSELPNNWTWSTVGAVTDYIQRGKSPKYAERSELPVINQKCIRWNELQLQHLKYIHPDQVSAWDEPRHIRPGDILWNSTGTGTVGRAYLAKEADCIPTKVVDSHVTIVRAAQGLEPRYLFNWIKSPAVQNKIEEMCDGTTNQIELSRTAIAETAVPVAPKEEQTRIADQLDILLARIKACNDHLDAVPGLLKRFRRAVIDAGTTGALTEEWRSSEGAPSDSTAEAGLANTKVAAIALDLRYGTSKKCDYSSAGVPVLRIPNIANQGRIDLSDLKSAEFDSNELAKLSLQEGDLLVIRSNGSLDLVGKTSVVTKAEVGLLFAGYLMRLRVDTRLAVPEFIQLCLSASGQRRYIEQTAKSTSGVNNLNAEELRALKLWLPDLAEQREVVRRAGALFQFAAGIEASFRSMSGRTRRLAPQVLARAFRGELLPQDPNDEPVSVLLERVAGERNQAGAAPKARQPRAPRFARLPQATSSTSKAMPTKSRQDEDVKGQPYLAGHLRRLGQPVDAKTLYEASELPVADFYKQLAWEITEGHVNDADPLLEPTRHAA